MNKNIFSLIEDKIKGYKIYKLLNLFSIFKERIPIIKENTFLVWEPCSKSHAEVVPGFCKYLLDLGYHVSVLITPDRYKEGLFSRFNNNENISFNKLSQKQIRKYFKNSDLSNVKGLLVTTVGKLYDEVNYDEIYNTFNQNVDKSKIFFVEHEAKYAVDKGIWKDNLITLRELNYKGAKSIVINPHYFGEIKITPKNEDITNFVTVGAIRDKRKNNEQIINSIEELYKKGYKNFKVTVIGKGTLKAFDKELRPYIDIKGRLPFDKMYDEIEKADFMLTSYNADNPAHQRYNTTGTSGNFQLVYGFLKPCIILDSFAPINGFGDNNSILYNKDNEYPLAMEKAINMSQDEYLKLQENLKVYTNDFYNRSLDNLRGLIND